MKKTILMIAIVLLSAKSLALLARSETVTVYAEPAPVVATTSVVTPKKKYYSAPVSTTTLALQQYTKEIALEYQISPNMLVELIGCESSYNPNAVHDHNTGKGVTGFHRDTFMKWNNKFFDGNLKYTRQEDQIKLMARAFQEGETYRHAWTTYTRYKNKGTCKPIKVLVAQS